MKITVFPCPRSLNPGVSLRPRRITKYVVSLEGFGDFEVEAPGENVAIGWARNKAGISRDTHVRCSIRISE